MSRKTLTVAIATSVCLLALTGSSFGRARLESGGDRGSAGSFAAQNVAHCVAAHNVGQLVLAVNNNGTFGLGFTVGSQQDCFTGAAIPAGGCEYPKGSRNQYLFAASFWIGAVVGRDTLVSVGADGWFQTREMYPDVPPFGDMVYRSIIDPTKPEYVGAVSEQDYIATYTDTFTNLPVENDGFDVVHKPLHIAVTQASYAWSYSYAEDIILFDYQIKNIGTQRLQNVYMGVYVDADVCSDCGTRGFDDDIAGFLVTQDRTYFDRCTYTDTIYAAWIADNDGELIPQAPTDRPVPNVTATRIVRTPAETLDVSFNWWVSNGTAALDYGPRERSYVGRLKEQYRDFGTGGSGTPVGDRNKYYTLRNREFDYDQIYTATIGAADTLWQLPPQNIAADVANGYDTRYLLSFGPFDIPSGGKLPLSFAYFGGRNLHTDPNNATANLPNNPEAYYANLDFSNLGTNATWAAWIYDNPGVDTDSDGYFGKFRECPRTKQGGDSTVIDTIWYEGDGVPDFKGASPPPAPTIRLAPRQYGHITVYFNGMRSETTKDNFSNDFDFEGYRVYIGRDDRASSFSLLTSYDRADFNRYIYDSTAAANTDPWKLRETPFTLEQLRQIYNDPTFDPTMYPRSNPYNEDPSNPKDLVYFAPQDYNQSGLGGPGQIRKVFPNAPYPTTLDLEAAPDSELTNNGELKYFEYAFEIDSILPTVPYYINVTAFDYGSPQSGLASLETSVSLGAKQTYPLAEWDQVKKDDLKVFVYPNPYRLDGGYRNLGFEGRREADRPDDRVREIHFANLPPKCTISIFTLDGDLVREIDHNMNPSDPNSTHDSWNLITRNTQLVVSGLYYWTVESDDGEVQVGKLAIIM